MKKILAILIISTFIGCGTDIKSNEELTTKIHYYKDEDTNLCFGQIISTTYYGYTVSSVTCVPCDSVTKLLEK